MKFWHAFLEKYHLRKSSIWLSGKERYFFVDGLGREFECDVFFDGNVNNTLILSSFTDKSGFPITKEKEKELIEKMRIFFERKGESLLVL